MFCIHREIRTRLKKQVWDLIVIQLFLFLLCSFGFVLMETTIYEEIVNLFAVSISICYINQVI